MNKLGLLILLAALAFPVMGSAQFMEDNVVSGDAYIWQLCTQCPCEVDEGWVIKSVVSLGDTVTLELETPGLLSGFLGMLTSRSPKTKRLWVDELAQYGEPWKKLLTILSEEKRWLKLVLSSHGSTETSCLIVSPDEIGTILAKD